jgi:hypothetical protein
MKNGGLHPLCDFDDYEPNNNRFTQAAPISLEVVIVATFCGREQLIIPKNEDNYRFTTITSGMPWIELTMPGSLRPYLIWLYDSSHLTRGSELCGSTIDAETTTLKCSPVQPGTYVLRIYPDDITAFDDINPYSLRVTVH